MVQHAGPLALTQLSEDERMFRDSVRQFATEKIGPLVRSMDEAQQMDAGLIRQMFELGLMGIEVPEQYGGAGGTFFEAILGVEAISAVDPSVGVLVDVQNTLCINALIRWATEDQKKSLSDAACAGHHRSLRTERGEFRLGRLRLADTRGQAR
jgi:alkylation response protein AidB-like acyl-CoA dehydrogenase